MEVVIFSGGQYITTLRPGDLLDLAAKDSGCLVYYTEEEAVHIRGLLAIRQAETRQVIEFVENRVRNEKKN